MSWKKVAYLDEVATLSDTPPQDVKVQTASAGVGAAASRDDHKHNVTVGVPGNITENDTAAEGTSGNLARQDHKHGSPISWTPASHELSGHTQAVAELLINKQAVRNPVIDPQATPPASPVDGQVYYSTADDHLYCYVA